MAISSPTDEELVEPPAARLEQQSGRLRALLGAGDYALAQRAAEALLEKSPQSREGLYALAVCQRRQRRVADALKTLSRLEALQPTFARLFQERGQCHVAERNASAAIAAFERAVQLNAALPASWQALQGLYAMSARAAESAQAAARAAELAKLPREIVKASALLTEGELYEAERIVRAFLLEHGDHIEAMRLLARIGIELDVLDDAELLLSSVLERAPDYHAARYDYAIVLLKRHKHVRAREEIQKLLQQEPDNRIFRTTDAAVSMGFGHYARAHLIYERLSAESPQDPELQLSVAHALKTLGRTAQAIDAYHAAVAAAPGYGEAYWSLANLKTYRFTDPELSQMRAQQGRAALRLSDRYHLCFALGKALEDRAEYRESFEFYRLGNALKQSELRYRPEVIETHARLQAAVCSAPFFKARRGFGDRSVAPIFIVGLPRSGSTLLEQILASHSQVEATSELADIPRLVQDLQGRQHENAQPRYPGVLERLEREEFLRFGSSYLAGTRIYRVAGKPIFIDKNPNNFRHLGLIHLMLPEARIIDARRRPMACCFGNYKQLFAVGQRFSYGLEHLARYYRSYVTLMDHWGQVLPGRILRVQYEDLVQDLEGSVRRLLEFCALDFERSCLEFHRTARSIDTASSEQVRQPIYRAALDQWRHYEPWLAPLRAALGPLAES